MKKKLKKPNPTSKLDPTYNPNYEPVQLNNPLRQESQNHMSSMENEKHIMDSQSNEKHFNLVAQESKPLNNPTIPNIGYNSLQNEPYQRDFDFPNGQINK